MNNSYVESLRDPMKLETIYETFQLSGFHSIKIRYLMDKQVLLKYLEGWTVQEMLEGPEEWLEVIFYDVRL